MIKNCAVRDTPASI